MIIFRWENTVDVINWWVAFVCGKWRGKWGRDLLTSYYYFFISYFSSDLSAKFGILLLMSSAKIGRRENDTKWISNPSHVKTYFMVTLIEILE